MPEKRTPKEDERTPGLELFPVSLAEPWSGLSRLDIGPYKIGIAITNEDGDQDPEAAGAALESWVTACNSVSSLREALAFYAGETVHGLAGDNGYRARAVLAQLRSGLLASEPVADQSQLREALAEMIYETTHLSPMEPDGGHRCIISGATLEKARAALSGVTQPATSELENLRAIVAAIRTYRDAIYREVVPEDALLGQKEWHALEALLDAQSATEPCKKCGGSGWRDAIDGSDGSYITSRPCSCGGQPSTEVEKPMEVAMTEAQIKHMVDRFLSWKLPESFNPDGGISFKKTFNEHTPYPSKHEPYGTNLFNFDEATAMVRHMLEGLPSTEVEKISTDTEVR